MSLEHFSKEILGKDIPLYSLKLALYLLSDGKEIENIDELCKKMFITKRKLVGEFEKFKPIDGFYAIEKDESNYVVYILNNKYTLESPKKKKGKASDKKAKKLSQREQEIIELFTLWCEVMGKTTRTNLDAARRRVLNTALDAYGFETCRKAIIGCSKSTWHMGVSERSNGTQYNSLELIFRNADKLEYFTERYDAPSLEEQIKIENSNKRVKIEDRMEDNDWLNQRLGAFSENVQNNSTLEQKNNKSLMIESKSSYTKPIYDVEGLAEESLKYFLFNEKELDNSEEFIENAVFEEIEEEEVPLYMQFAKDKE